MGYGKNDFMGADDCDKLRDEITYYLSKNKIGTPRLAKMSGVGADKIRAFLWGETKSLHVVMFGKLYISIHPDSEAGKP